MRYLIKYSKGYDIKFVSHLDIMRNIQRAFNRSGLPVEHSKGFNPHMIMSIAQPLSVGIYSVGEYMDVEFLEEVSEEEIKNKFNEVSPVDLKIIDVLKIEKKYYDDGKKVEQSMAAIDAARYTINIRYKNVENLAEEMKKLLSKTEWITLKKSKKTEKMVNIKSMIRKLNYKIDGSTLQIDALLSCGSRENLSPELLCNYIKDNTSYADADLFCEVRREEMYGLKQNNLVSLFKFFKI